MSVIGVVKQFGGRKGFGFIASDEVEGDAYFQERDLPPGFRGIPQDVMKLEGCTVSFEPHTSPDGKQQARNVKLMSFAADDGTVTLFGEVKSFNVAKGFGFLACSGVEGDVFFQCRDVPGHLRRQKLNGLAVIFEHHESADGKPQARRLRFLAGGSGGGGGGGGGGDHPAAGPPLAPPPMWPMPGMPPMFMPPHPAYAPPGAYGPGPGIYAGKGGTVRIGMAMPGMPPPMPMMPGMPHGMPRAVPSSSLGKGGSRQSSQSQRGGGRNSLPQDGETLSGVVKSFNADKGWGFISQAKVPSDLYFKSDEPIESGQQVSFAMKWTKDGKPQARDVKPMVDDGTTVVGVIMSLSDKNGYGFIKAGDLPQDVYFQKKDLPAEMNGIAPDDIAGTQISCTIKFQKDGKPVGTHIAPIEGAPKQKVPRSGGGGRSGRKRSAGGGDSGVQTPAAKRQRSEFTPGAPSAAPSDAAGELLDGEIKSYNAAKGWGFISSPGSEADVYFKTTSLPADLRKKQASQLTSKQVLFTVHLTADGKPQASNIEVVDA